jgi:hypothetical protein
VNSEPEQNIEPQDQTVPADAAAVDPVAAILEGYNFEDYHRFDFGRGYFLTIGRAGLKAYRDAVVAHYEKNEGRRGGRAKAESNDQFAAWNSGQIAQHLFKSLEGPGITDSGKSVFLACMKNRDYYLDVIRCINDQEVYSRGEMEDTAQD